MLLSKSFFDDIFTWLDFYYSLRPWYFNQCTTSPFAFMILAVISGPTSIDIPQDVTVGLDLQVPIIEVNDNYLNSSFMLPRGNTDARGKVIVRKIDASGNDVGRRNDNTILDTRKYRVDVGDGEVIKLTENVIIESMYAACNDSRNE